MVHQPDSSSPPKVDEACMLNDSSNDVLLSDITSFSENSNSRLSVSGLSLRDGRTRQEVFGKVRRSLAKELHISDVSSAHDMTELLEMTRQNPNIGQVELVSCRLTSQHFALLPASTKLVSCQTTTEGELHFCCTSNSQLTHLHLQDMILHTSMVYAMQSFGNFPSLQSFRLVACHLTEESYQALSAFLAETSGRLQSLRIDLRVWNDKSVTRSGLSQAIGEHESIHELQLNGRVLEQLSTDTMLALCGSSSQRRLQLTYQPTELRRFGEELNQLTETTENLHAIDITEFGTVSSLSVADYDTTLSTLITAVAKSTTIRSLALPALSKTLSQHLAESLSQNESLVQVASPSIAWTPALSRALHQRSTLHVVNLSSAAAGETQRQQQHEPVVQTNSLPARINHQRTQLQDLDRCSLPPTRKHQEDATKVELKSKLLSKGNKNDFLNKICTLKPTAATKKRPASTYSKPCPVLDSSPEYQQAPIAP